ncbi:MAG: c-type cytochrome [Gemmataceae bacterium]
MHTLERNDAKGVNTAFPTKLSETGLFRDVKRHEMAEGIREFEPNARQWQDGAISRYFAAFPDTSSATLFDKPRKLPGQVYWHDFRMQFPKDAVLVKTLTLNVYVENKLQKKRVETQLLHFDGEDWHGYSFAWRDDQSDAELVPADGAEKVFRVANAVTFPLASKPEELGLQQTWTFHSRNQCMQCHNAWSEYTLAFNPRQLNGGFQGRPFAFGGEIKIPNYLIELNEQGYIRRVGADDKPLPVFDTTTAAKEPRLPTAFQMQNVRNEDVARAYLHVNCAHCHRFGGGGGQVVLELDYAKQLKETGILDVVPKQGDFGITDARIIKPGEPFKSVLLYRMTKFGRGRMPHLGSESPDSAGLRLIDNWISHLALEKWKEPEVNREKPEQNLRSTDTAFPFSFQMSTQGLDGQAMRQALAVAAKLEPGPVRDLFEGYLPADPKGRKLGSNPRPQSILSLKGDATKGEVIFFNKDMKCVNCHKIGDKGTALGPDLTAIGKTRTRAELLESLLQPSLQVEPQFAAYLVQTKDEKTFTGLLVKRDDKQVVLRDAENKEIVLAAENLESVRPSRLSLMPDGQMAGLRPQEAADLLEFLTTRR